MRPIQHISHSEFIFIFPLRSPELIEFRKIIDEFIGIAETIVGEVEQEKMQAVAAQNHLKSISKQREFAQQEIQVISSLAKRSRFRGDCFNQPWFQNQILEKTMELEQKKIQLKYLQRIEYEQQKIIENFYENS